MAEPTNRRQRPGTQLSPLEAAYAKCRSALVYTIIFSCVVNILMLTGPLFMMQVYDRVLTSRSIDTLVALSILTAALYAVSGVLELIRARLMTRVGARIDADIRNLTFSRVVEHAVRHTPNVGTQPIRDLDAIRQFTASPAPFSLLDMPWAPLYLGVTYLIHPMLAALAFAGAVILFALALLNEISSRKGGVQGAAGTMKAHLLAEQATGGAEILRGMGMEGTFGAVWSRNYEAGAEHQRQAADRNGIFSSATKTLRLMLQSAVLALGAYLVIFNEITPGSMIAASIITARALAPVEQAIGHWRSFLSYRQSKRRLEQVLGELEGTHERMTLPAPKGAVSVEGVAIVPPRSGKPLLQGLQFALRPGEGLGVIGPTGAGKSSLARTMIGVWPAAKGSVRLDGAALEQYPPEQLGRAVGYLPQDVILFPGTIQENIARFTPDASPEAVVKAAQAANVHDLVLRLPDGYNTKVGFDGVQLSGGQKQRIGLARALYGDPVLIVLDEPNSNLDSDGEAALLKALIEARQRGATLIVVAHRPSAIRAVDYLLYLKDGRQIAFGPKEEVLAKISQADKPQRQAAAGGLSVVSDT